MSEYGGACDAGFAAVVFAAVAADAVAGVALEQDPVTGVELDIVVCDGELAAAVVEAFCPDAAVVIGLDQTAFEPDIPQSLRWTPYQALRAISQSRISASSQASISSPHP